MLFVCIGNICRSPLGEALLRDALPAEGFDVSSAGVRAVVGSAMSPDAARELAARGGDAGDFRARQLTEEMVEESDLVLTATRELRSRVLEDSPGALRRTFTVREFAALLDQVDDEDLHEMVAEAAAKRSRVVIDDFNIADPYGQGNEAHAIAAEQMDKAVQRIARGLT